MALYQHLNTDSLKSMARTHFGLQMETTETNGRQSYSSNDQSSSEKLLPDSENSYEDDFEDLHTNDISTEEPTRSKTVKDNSKRDVIQEPHDLNDSQDSDSQQEKGQKETSGKVPKEKDNAHPAGKTERSPFHANYDDGPSDDSEPEPEGDNYVITEDQQRAMMELMAIKKESGDYQDDPPEYNVKERLKELNEELAKEPEPEVVDREHRVGFKETLVDLVAPPPPDTSDGDEEVTPRKTKPDKPESPALNDKQSGDGRLVVERDGKFEVVPVDELTASERALYIPEDNVNKTAERTKVHDGSGDKNNHDIYNSNARHHKENLQPVPPSKPRPSTSTGYSRRGVRPARSPRPQSAWGYQSHLDNFEYYSPYAMSPAEKQRNQERARLREQQQIEQERRRQEEEERNRKERDEAFLAWLEKKQEEDKKKKQEEKEAKKQNDKPDKSEDTEKKKSTTEGFSHIPLLESFEPIFRLKSEEVKKAYKTWLEEKHKQIQKEKLLKKRQEQELWDGYYLHSREECDKAYKEWLKRKRAEIYKKKAAEKQRYKIYRSQARKSRKNLMFARALSQSQAFRYVDYYGYRF